ENPEETMSEDTRVREAVELGLIESDSITRRILVDGARRLIRATALAQVPTEEGMQRYLEENSSRYQLPGRTRLIHVALNRNQRGDQTLSAAEAMLARLRSEKLSPEEGAALGDETVVEASLPPMTDRAIARRFGLGFTEAVADLPVGSWQGPIRSPLGQHLVFIQERNPPRRARLEEVRSQVSSDIRNEVANEILAARVRELREQYDLRIEGSES
ncbi:MAG: peptidylprolyl isomerase, partial [Myxococcota bacterium]|nr:peptidylprolyl isomerase [Myxococcota bacterium]